MTIKWNRGGASTAPGDRPSPAPPKVCQAGQEERTIRQSPPRQSPGLRQDEGNMPPKTLLPMAAKPLNKTAEITSMGTSSVKPTCTHTHYN